MVEQAGMHPHHCASWRDNLDGMPLHTTFRKSGSRQLPAGWPEIMAARMSRSYHLSSLKISSTGISSKYTKRGGSGFLHVSEGSSGITHYIILNIPPRIKALTCAFAAMSTFASKCKSALEQVQSRMLKEVVLRSLSLVQIRFLYWIRLCLIF